MTTQSFQHWVKKHYGNIIFVLLITILIIPQTRMPVQVFLQRLLAGSPNIIEKNKQVQLSNYDWNLQTLENTYVNFSTSTNKVAVINFWATWCPPCVAEMPSLQKLFDQYGAKVDFYFIAAEDESVIRNFLNQKNYTIPVYIEQSATPDQLKSTAYPTTYIIAKNGRIVMDKTGAANWNSAKVKELLDTLLRIN